MGMQRITRDGMCPRESDGKHSVVVVLLSEPSAVVFAPEHRFAARGYSPYPRKKRRQKSPPM